MNSFVLSVLLLLSLFIQSECGCFDDWSRCTPLTSFATGILWKSCPEFCRKCKGREGGDCVPVKNKPCSGGYQCECTGGSYPKSRDPRDIFTCARGL